MTNPIEEYDQELLGDISSLEQYIVDWVSHELQLKAHELQLKGCPKMIADDIVKDDIAKEERETSEYARGLNGLLDLMKELASCIKDFPFRVALYSPSSREIDKFPPEIILPSGYFQFNLSVLDDDERKIFLNHVETISETYHSCESWQFFEKETYHSIGQHHCYPSVQLMEFIQDMLMTSRREQFLVPIVCN